ncbi:hypothetical protein RJ639_008831 [Escallonia herrerae]|uniref:RING-type E3 ubiquitin transferase n=1 Tax=Escallonia herrerae TaxID=1293975 RepID=A0AA88VUV2_9ASTE|nr:hypothetical protein RJ639_008831 [Escallonia herrerae]
MGVLILFVLFPFIFVDALATCSSLQCGHDDPDIRFPFGVRGHHDQRCSHPGFELFCKQNKTIVHFPSYGDLVVKSISYDIKKLNLLDPKNCVHGVFLNLNLSLTPFEYYYVVKNFTYLNCSTRLSPSFDQVPCLSSSNYHVYVVESTLEAPASCKHVKTVAIPFAYTPYLSDNSFGLGLTWGTCRKDSGTEGGRSGVQSKIGHQRCFMVAHGKASSITFVILMVALVIGVKTYSSKKLNRQTAKIHQEVEKLLGDRKALAAHI